MPKWSSAVLNAVRDTPALLILNRGQTPERVAKPVLPLTRLNTAIISDKTG